jgi:hypothetical protein
MLARDLPLISLPGLPALVPWFWGAGAVLVTVLLAIWWRQQTFRWPLVMALCILAAPALSWWSGFVFQVADYRAGCDGLCAGFSGAPVAFFRGEAAGRVFLPGLFVLNGLVYLTVLLAWSAVVLAFSTRSAWLARRRGGVRAMAALVLLVAPAMLAPIYLAPPEAKVRGDPQRVAINAEREVYMYANQSQVPVLRVGLVDVRPRTDGSTGLRVCLRIYSFFYLPAGYMYLDMAPEGVHSTAGGVRTGNESCWDQG